MPKGKRHHVRRYMTPGQYVAACFRDARRIDVEFILFVFPPVEERFNRWLALNPTADPSRQEAVRVHLSYNDGKDARDWYEQICPNAILTDVGVLPLTNFMHLRHEINRLCETA